MSAFAWRAATAAGNVVTGELEAPDRREALAELRRRGLVPIDVSVTARTLTKGTVRRGAATAAFTRSLAALLGAGLPLDRALAAAAAQAAHPAVAFAANTIRRDVESGIALGAAMAKHPRVFSGMAIATLSVGDHAGALAPAAERLADYLDEEAELKAQIRGALLYPAIMALVATIGVVVVLLVVLPRFVAILGETGGTLPLSTRMLVGISHVVVGGWWAWLPAIVIAIASGMQLLANVERLTRFHAARLRWPVVGPLESMIATARITRTLGILLQAGARVVPAISIAAIASRNLAIVHRVSRAAEAVGRGERVSDALAPVLPPLAAQLIAAGEESGRLDAMCLRAADTYDAEVRRTLRTAVGLIEPVLILVFGGIVGFVALAMLQAVYSINVGGL